MSDIVENLKDAINPSRREKATAPAYDPRTRGAYAEAPAEQPQLAPPLDGKTAAEKNAAGSNHTKMTAPDSSPKLATNANFNAPEGTYGPHNSRIANALDPRVDSDRDGHPAHGVSGYGGASSQPVKNKNN